MGREGLVKVCNGKVAQCSGCIYSLIQNIFPDEKISKDNHAS